MKTIQNAPEYPSSTGDSTRDKIIELLASYHTDEIDITRLIDSIFELFEKQNLRDELAARAMQGICAAPVEHSGQYDWIEENVKHAYKIADSMLAERGRYERD